MQDPCFQNKQQATAFAAMFLKMAVANIALVVAVAI